MVIVETWAWFVFRQSDVINDVISSVKKERIADKDSVET